MIKSKVKLKTKAKKSSKPGVKKINAKMTIMEIIETRPESAEILFQSGLACIGCHMSGFETLEEGCKVHGMNKKDIDELVKVINGEGI